MSEQPKEVLRASEANTHALRTLRERAAEAIKRVHEVAPFPGPDMDEITDAVLAAVSAHITEGLDEAARVRAWWYDPTVVHAALTALGLPSPEQEQTP